MKRKISFLITALACFAFSIFALNAFSNDPLVCCNHSPEDTCFSFVADVENPAKPGEMIPVTFTIPGLEAECQVH